MEDSQKLTLTDKLKLGFNSGILAVYFGGFSIDALNQLGARQAWGTNWAGEITNHTGDIVWGYLATYGAHLIGSMIEAAGVDRKCAQAVKYIACGLLNLAVVTAELTGFHNTPDIKDLPGIALGVAGAVGAASLGEIAKKISELKK